MLKSKDIYSNLTYGISWISFWHMWHSQISQREFFSLKLSISIPNNLKRLGTKTTPKKCLSSKLRWKPHLSRFFFSIYFFFPLFACAGTGGQVGWNADSKIKDSQPTCNCMVLLLDGNSEHVAQRKIDLFGEKKFRFVITLDLIKCLKKIK